MVRKESAINRQKRHFPACENVFEGFEERFFDYSTLDYPEELEDPDEL